MDKFHILGVIGLTSSLFLCAWSSGLAQEPVTNTVTPSCAVSLVDPTESGADSEKIVEVLRGITKALADHDYTAMAAYMDENCSTYNERTKTLVTGRDNIIAAVKSNVESEERRLKVPPIRFTVDHPYVKVNGDTATVNFVLVKEIAGAHPAKFESHCIDVFVRQSGQWKKLMYRGDDWKSVK